MRELQEAVGPGALISDRAERGTYQSDGLKSYAVTPGVVVLPESAEQVAAVVRACHRGRVPHRSVCQRPRAEALQVETSGSGIDRTKGGKEE